MTQAGQNADIGPGTMVTPNVRLVRMLGEGGMGSVWVAEHLSLDTEVAVKFILPEMLDYGEGGTFARFRQEAKAAARVKSPHVVQVFDQGIMEPSQTPYIVMELLEGESLGDRLQRDERLSTADTVEVVEQTARALGKAHEQDIVHRDIKPDNIYLVAGDSIFCKVLDFGIAKRTDQDAGDAKTRTGLVVGSPQYMSPERLKQRETDFRADLWALSVVVYQTLTGKLPFDGETLTGLMLNICAGEYTPPSALFPQMPPHLDAWFQRALHKDPNQRFGSARELADSFKEVAKLGRFSDWPPAGGVAARPITGEEAVPPATVPSYPPVQGVQTGDQPTPGLITGPQLPAQGTGPTVAMSTGSNPGVITGPHGQVGTGSGPQPIAATQLGAPADQSGMQVLPGTLGGAANTLGGTPAVGQAGSKTGLLLGIGGIALVAVAAAAFFALRGGDDETQGPAEAAATATATASATGPTATAAAKPAKPPPAGMVAIPAAKYKIGCDDSAPYKCYGDEKPIHEVDVRAFAIMTNEVTAEEYDLCVGKDVCPPAGKDDGCTWQKSGQETRPINCVTWQ
ncbi:MAG: protein kinase, partial [Deltaproteobacteria bacterium]|nr:protein kinase [Deltaproteobacteria bacterium]MBW2534560.1 protein kinase [Deltaproteobacteria bacterium]